MLTGLVDKVLAEVTVEDEKFDADEGIEATKPEESLDSPSILSTHLSRCILDIVGRH